MAPAFELTEKKQELVDFPIDKPDCFGSKVCSAPIQDGVASLCAL